MEPKYKIGDKVWYMKDNQVKEDTITGVLKRINFLSEVYFEYDFTTLKPNLGGNSFPNFEFFTFDEEKLFHSKEELIASL